MSNDPETTPRAANDAPPDFNATPWQILIGVMAASDPANPSNMTEGLMIDMVAADSVMQNTPQGPRPDKTNEAVHFAQWFNQNKQHLVALWRTEYVQYMNLRMLTMNQPKSPIQLVGADGSKLQ